MPPLPLNGTSYPPTSSGYQPLNLHADDDEDLESSAYPTRSSSRRVKVRTFTHSPYRSQANNPTDLLQCFLSDTRPQEPHTKELSLRIRVIHPSTPVAKTIDIPLLKVSSVDGLPYALADDVPALRGLPSGGSQGWKQNLVGLVSQLKGASSTSYNPKQGERLQVWNSAQKKPLYATSEEISRSQSRDASGTHPPWAPVTDDFLPPPNQPATTAENTNGERDADKLLTGGSMGDFDLGTVFQRPAKRQTSRLVSVGLQEAFERFADDRHFSKHLVCKEAVWGWDLHKFRRQLQSVAVEALSGTTGGGKGKARQEEDVEGEEMRVELEVMGLDQGLVYHVVWAPIPWLSRDATVMFCSRASLVAIVLVSSLFITSVLLGFVGNTLVIIATAFTIAGWGGLMYLLRTQGDCVYDTIGTAWNLTPRWVKLSHTDPSWNRERVLASLKPTPIRDNDEVKVEKRGEEGWFLRRGLDQEEWLQTHRSQLSHLLRGSQS
ncbi:uncharacterized protein UTRI_02037_B [Ustilago trichophora]|uniref:Uncharacterized protein n=1 Tax=Ustilago trichophora TaxID=86804 RepID=A0A5C3DWL9_9BASI|nr:uncharacterized protein UTRI_02037_B [Ustilago trichophora]